MAGVCVSPPFSVGTDTCGMAVAAGAGARDPGPFPIACAAAGLRAGAKQRTRRRRFLAAWAGAIHSALGVGRGAPPECRQQSGYLLMDLFRLINHQQAAVLKLVGRDRSEPPFSTQVLVATVFWIKSTSG